MKQYKAIPGPQLSEAENGQQAAEAFMALVNQHSSGGWIYRSMETIQIKDGSVRKPRCTDLYILVFERTV